MHIVLSEFVRELQETYEYNNESDSKLFEYFCNYCIVSQFFLGRFEPDTVTTCDVDAGIDGVAIIINGDLITSVDDAIQVLESHKTNLEATIVFTQVKTSEKFEKKEIANFSTGVKDFLSLNPKLPYGDINKEALEIVKLIFKNLKKIKDKQPKVEVYYCTSGSYNQEEEIKAAFDIFLKEIDDLGLFKSVGVLPLGRKELMALWKSSHTKNETKFKVVDYFGMPPMPNIKQSYVALINAKEFVDKALKDSNGNIKNEVFEENIRAYLGDQTDVNSNIKSTLNDNERKKLFSVLNNGITIVTPELTITPNTKEIDLVNYQVINGCQTSNTLFENYQDLDENINIVVKCIESSNEDNIQDIIAATNSQTAIYKEAFYALTGKSRMIQKYFESQNSESKDVKLYFERRENEFKQENIHSTRIFDIKLLCRAYNAMFLGEPNTSARYVNKIFDIKKDELFKDSDEESLYYTSCYTLYRFNTLVKSKRINAHKYTKFRWHILELFRYVVHNTVNNISANSLKAKKYTEPLIKILDSNKREYEKIFSECFIIIDSISNPTTDSLKRAKYCNDLRIAAKDYLKQKNLSQ